MRTAALLFGLVAGLFALVVPIGVDSDLLTPFLKIWATTPGQRMLGTVAWYAPAALAMLGGLLAVLTPGFAALLLLAAAAIWFGIGLSDPQFLDYQLLVPAGFALAAAVLSFVAGELAVRQVRAARREKKPPVATATPSRPEPESATVEADRETAFRMDPRLVPREEAPPRPAREIPLTLDDVIPREAPPEPPKRKPETIWPETPVKRSVFDRPIEAARRSPILERETERPRVEPDTPRPVVAPGRVNRLVLALAAFNGVVVVALGLAVAFLLIDSRQSPSTVATPVAEAAPAPAAPVTPAQTPAETPAVPEEADQRLTPNLLPALQPAAVLAPAADAAAVTEQPTEAADEQPAVSLTGLSDPHAYCDAVRTIDYVDRRYEGPRFTSDIAEALRVPLRSAPDRVSWRCVDGVVYACASFDWPVCAMTPTAEEMLEYCRRNPAVGRLLAPNGTWSCEAGKPKLPDGASWPVDERGFFPPAWIPVFPPETPPTG
ncbi:MAG: hypothetical protein IPK28_00175 [Devosia sp.]|nr:hypothetical protein [Devosia sp.]